MATQSDGKVIISTELDNSQIPKGVADIKGSLGGLDSVLKNIGGKIMAAFSVHTIAQFAKECVNLGSDLQEVQNVVDVTFGNLNTAINEFSKNAIEQFGLSELAAKQYSSTMGSMLKSMGFTTDQASAMSMELTGLAGDMASFYNLSGDDAFGKIRSGIAGETEPLKQLGINLSVANLEQYALAQGITKAYNAMTQQEQALLRYNYLLSVTSDAQGDFSRTSESWANQTRILTERFNSVKAAIGQGLINALTPVIRVINVILAGLQTLANAFQQFTALLFGDAGGGSAGVSAAELEDVASGYSAAAEGAEDLANGAGAAGKAAKKSLASFDEIHKLGEDTSGGSGGTGGSGGISGIGELDFGTIPVTADIQDEISPKLQEIVDKIKSLFEPLKKIDFEPLRKSLGKLQTSFKKLGNVIGKSLEWAWFNILVPLAEWTIEEAMPTLIETLAAAFEFLGQVIEECAPVAEALWNEFLEPLAEWTGDAIVKGLEVVTQGFENLTTSMEEDSKDASDFIIESFDQAARITDSGFIVPTREEMKLLSDQIGEWFKKSSDAVTTAWSTVSEWFRKNVVQPIKDMFGNIWDTVSGVFSGEITFGELVDSLAQAFEDMVNDLVGGLNSMIMTLVNKINTFIIRIKFTKILGKYPFGGINTIYPTPQIPYLAQGAVVPPNAPFLAVLGDQKHGTNIEAPLSTIEQALRNVMAEGGQEFSITINYTGDLAGLARYLKPAIDVEATRRGPSLAKVVTVND